MLCLLDLTEPAYRTGYLARAPQPSPAPQPAGVVSVLVPLYAPPRGYLRRAIDSVRRQSYPFWQLVLSPDGSCETDADDGTLLAWLMEEVRDEPRILVRPSPQRGHISRTTNYALQHATGEFVAFLDQDDELAPRALETMVQAFVHNPEAQLAYSDEDRIDPHGARFLPYFKPAWSPDLLRSQNYICHLAMVRSAHVRRLGGLRVGYEGSQDHDLALRICDELDASQIVHVPEVLYHWRTLESSTATHGAQAKPYALAAGARAIADSALRKGTQAQVHSELGFYRVSWPMPKDIGAVSILLHGAVDVHARDAFARAVARALPNVVTDVACLSATREPAAVDAASHHANPPASNEAIDHAIASASGDAVVLLAACHAGHDASWLPALLGHLGRPEVAFVTGKRVDAGGQVLEIGLVLDPVHGPRPSHAGCPPRADGYFGRALLTHNVAAVSRNCLTVRRSRWLELGGLAGGHPGCCAEVQLAERARAAGYVHVAEAWAVLCCHGGGACACAAPTGQPKACPPCTTTYSADPYFSVHLTAVPQSHTLRA